jgi:four helix bundle protein
VSGHLPIEEMELFRRYVDVADWAWDEVEKWSPLAQDTVGKQLVRAADSVGANLVEGDGRSTDPDSVRFFVIGRASARETRYWLNRAARRKLIPQEAADAKVEELVSATQLLNRLINYRRSARKAAVVKEAPVEYSTDTPNDNLW